MKAIKQKNEIYKVLCLGFFLVSSVLIAWRGPSAAPDWIRKYPVAHRALVGENSIENSLGAISESIFHENIAIELDVRRLADGNLVVFHDADMMRMAGSNEKLSVMNLQNIQLYFLSGTNEKIHTLTEVLDFVNGRIPIILDIKTGGNLHTALTVIKSIKGYNGKIAIQSHDPLTVFLFRLMAPSITRGQVTSTYINHPKVKGLLRVILKDMWLNHLTHPDFIAYGIYELSDDDIAKLKNLNRKTPVLLWTVKDKTGKKLPTSASVIIFLRGICDQILESDSKLIFSQSS